jgi:hypothetical protein
MYCSTRQPLPGVLAGGSRPAGWGARVAGARLALPEAAGARSTGAAGGDDGGALATEARGVADGGAGATGATLETDACGGADGAPAPGVAAVAVYPR